MKTSIFSILLLLIIFSSCEKKYDFICLSQSSRSTITPNIGINELMDSVTIDSSFIRTYFYNAFDNSSLFQHKIFLPHCYNASHNRRVDVFKMAIPMDSISHFSYFDEDIKMISAHFEKAYQGESFLQHFIESGAIIGTKLTDRTWSVSIDVITKPQIHYQNPEHLKIDAIFKI